jgi:hypothetical protein
MAPANSRIACWPFVTEYKLHKDPSSLSPHAAHAGADIDAQGFACRSYGRSGRRHRPCRGTSLPLSLAWWRDFALRFVADLCALGETAQADERRDFPAPAASDLTALIDKAPPMQGGEYLQLDVLIALWQSTERALEIDRQSWRSAGPSLHHSGFVDACDPWSSKSRLAMLKSWYGSIEPRSFRA